MFNVSMKTEVTILKEGTQVMNTGVENTKEHG